MLCTGLMRTTHGIKKWILRTEGGIGKHISFMHVVLLKSHTAYLETSLVKLLQKTEMVLITNKHVFFLYFLFENML